MLGYVLICLLFLAYVAIGLRARGGRGPSRGLMFGLSLTAMILLLKW